LRASAKKKLSSLPLTLASLEQQLQELERREDFEQKNMETTLSAKTDLDLSQLKKLSRAELIQVLPTLAPDQLLTKLLEQRQTTQMKQAELRENVGVNHPDVKQLVAVEKTLNEQIDQRVAGILKALELRSSASGANKTTATASTVLDEEEAEIRRLQTLIQNSPDLINGSPSFESPLITAAREGQLRTVEFLLGKGAKISVAFSGKTALHSAAQTGNRAMVELLLERGADVNARDGSAGTALHKAAQDGFLSIVELLLKYKADTGARNSKMNGEETPLHLAARAGHTATVKTLVAHGANVDDKDSGGDTPLQEAVASGHHDTAAALLDEKAGIEITDNNGRTPLHAAAEVGHLDMLKLLLERKASVNARDEQQATPLLLAVHKQHAAIVETLLTHGAHPDLPGRAIRSKGFGTSEPGTQFCRPLEYAVSGSNTNILLSLLNHGADVEGCETPGWRPLFRAIEAANGRTVGLLLAHKANPNLADNGGAVPLERGLRNPQIVKLLLSAGADPNHKNKSGWPVMLQAISQSKPEVLKLLLDSKADANATSPNGWTALHLAAGQGNREMVELLLSHKADVNVRNDEGQTPLDLAKSVVKSNPSQSSRSIESLLQQHGALSDLPNFNSIRITRQGLEKPLVVFTKGSRLTNQFTSLETVMSFYAKPSAVINGKMFTPLNELPFPDFGRLIIRRPSATTGGKEQEIKVSLLNVSNIVDCAKDVPVEFGDVIEIPERVHALNEAPDDPVRELETRLKEVKRAAERTEQLRKSGIPTPMENPLAIGVAEKLAEANAAIQRMACLQKTIQLVVAGERISITVDSWRDGFLNQALAKSESRSALRSSSDLSRVKVTRKDAKTGQSIALTVDATETNDSLWLHAGDVIEVPVKP
jgi:ankyrin repeat protein